MKRDLGGGMDADRATVAISTLLSGRMVSIGEHADGGWAVEMEDISKHATSLIEDHETFHYCHIETLYEEDHAYYRETVLQTLPPDEGQIHGVIIEGVYQRQINERDQPKATFEGRVAYVEAKDWQDAERAMEDTFSERTLGEYVNNLGYLRDGLKTIRYHRPSGFSRDTLKPARAIINEINRLILDMEADDAA